MGNARPTGRKHEEWWPDPGEEGPGTFLGSAFDAYMAAHAELRKSDYYKSGIVGSFNEMLTATKLHENSFCTNCPRLTACGG